ncbi:hypothetical protein LP420_40415 [Massilia sp. B-10]|nr:hypothetical protein LP420_40415 [Massilia sp. B-10]
MLAAFCVVSGTYRVTTKTVIEGAVQRAMVAPFQGYVAEGFVRASMTPSRPGSRWRAWKTVNCGSNARAGWPRKSKWNAATGRRRRWPNGPPWRSPRPRRSRPARATGPG